MSVDGCCDSVSTPRTFDKLLSIQIYLTESNSRGPKYGAILDLEIFSIVEDADIRSTYFLLRYIIHLSL